MHKLTQSAVKSFATLGVKVEVSHSSKSKARLAIVKAKSQAFKELKAPTFKGGSVRAGRIYKGENAGQFWGMVKLQTIKGDQFANWYNGLSEKQQSALHVIHAPVIELIEG